MYINKAMVFGNLTRDPEIRALPSGAQVCSFSLATNRRYKKDDKWEETSDFHNIVVFGRQAETCAQYLKKGASAFIEGRIQTRSWESEKGKQYRTEIIAERVQFGPRTGGSGEGSGNYSRNENSSNSSRGASKSSDESEGIAYPEEDINPDDIPF